MSLLIGQKLVKTAKIQMRQFDGFSNNVYFSKLNPFFQVHLRWQRQPVADALVTPTKTERHLNEKNLAPHFLVYKSAS